MSWILLLFLLTLTLLSLFPRTPLDHDTELMTHYKELLANDPSLVSVVSFNIRHDGEEFDQNNHYRNRVARLADFFNRTAPLLAGLQEPSSGQLLHLQSLLPPQYKPLGHERSFDRADRLRYDDYQTAILYDASRLVLVAHDHLWLSKTQRTPGSKSWNSRGIRTLTIGAFKRVDPAQACVQDATKLSEDSADFLHFNTHLDVWSAVARVEQARIVLHHIKKWRALYPKAAVFLTGDFNAANGQSPHRVLLNETDIESLLHDTWDTCSVSDDCRGHSYSHSFHGWLGTLADRYLGRLIHYALLAVHGNGLDLPRAIEWPTMEQTKNILLSLPSPSQLYEHAPHSLSRMHVDWILATQDARVKMTFIGKRLIKF